MSSIFTYWPGVPVKASATKKGCERKRSILRARCTVTLVLVGQLVDAEDGDDVLQLLVALEDLLDLRGHAVVLLAHDVGLEDACEVESSGSTAG